MSALRLARSCGPTTPSTVISRVRAARVPPTYARSASNQAKTTVADNVGTTTKTHTLPGEPVPKLPWAQYLNIRRSKRRWEMAVTVPCAFAGFAGGIAYFGSQDVDPTKPIFGIDPMFVYGFATVGCAGVGALIGPTLGASIWRLTHRRSMALIEAREREFYQHIVRNRVDPSWQSATNPVPDFYGEKIGSLSQYRQWLRDQNKYRRKAGWDDK